MGALLRSFANPRAQTFLDSGRDSAVAALTAFEDTVGYQNVKVNMFRGCEALIEPDLRRLFTRDFLLFRMPFDTIGNVHVSRVYVSETPLIKSVGSTFFYAKYIFCLLFWKFVRTLWIRSDVPQMVFESYPRGVPWFFPVRHFLRDFF